MTREEAIEFGNMWLQINEDCKDSSTYEFFQKATKALEEEAERKPTGTYEEMMTFHLSAIAAILIDISKSLAVIADKAESEVEDGECK
ncbi:MAG: hypothetical protein IKP50_00200 [Bacilli bacterium]|nr:hypothetical protein [Bacilli bacterium]